MIKNEWKSLWNNKILIIVVMAIIVIPVIYAGLFLKSMWDPYGNLDKLPVAVVNNDKSVEYNGKTLSVGSDMVDELKDNDSLDFHFVDSDEAEQGLKNGTYYMVITIPEDFSSDASTLMDDNPKKMELKYETNPGTNYIASKMSETALSKIREAVASKVTETYTQTVFDQIGTVGDGMQEAADGSTEIKDGLTTASDGNKTITTNLKKLADSTLTFKSGAETLTEGLKEYTDGVSQVDSGAAQLDEGVGTLTDKVPTLTNGVNTLNDGVKSYTDGVATLNANSAQITSGVNSLATGAQSLETGLDTLKSGTTQYVSGANTLADGVTQYVTAAVDQLYAGAQKVNAGAGAVSSALDTLETGTKDFPKAAAGVKALNAGFETLTANDEALTTGAADLKGAGSTVTSGISQLSVGGKTLASGVTTLSNGLKTYTDGVATLAGNNKALTSGTQQLADGAKTLADGAEQLASGTQTLHAGTQKLVSNNSKLNSGADQLADGAGQIQDGSSKLYDGSKELGDGITKLEDGSDTLATSLNDGAKEVKETNASDDTISMFATPITDEETKITTVENNGHAMAPYMMSVGLWVGCLAFCLMYPLTEHKGKLKSGFAWWASKASVLYPVAILQGVLLILLLHVFDGFTPVEMTKTILFAALTGACFTSIMYFFNITFGKVGSFLMLIFMVVQLAGSAGTYPVEISPSFVAKIHYYLPFTYTVNAFRSTICGGESIRQAVIVLIGLTIIFSILTILQFNHMARRKKQGKLVLLDWLEEKGVA
jgi:putative membrane protein